MSTLRVSIIKALIDYHMNFAPFSKDAPWIRKQFRLGTFSASFQANESAYCIPKNKIGPYEAIEVGFPNHDLLGLEDDCGSGVYAYVDTYKLAESISNIPGIWFSRAEILLDELEKKSIQFNSVGDNYINVVPTVKLIKWLKTVGFEYKKINPQELIIYINWR